MDETLVEQFEAADDGDGAQMSGDFDAGEKSSCQLWDVTDVGATDEVHKPSGRCHQRQSQHLHMFRVQEGPGG